ncbi:hypothetical protein ES703_116584 [subsurface metagenome]
MAEKTRWQTKGLDCWTKFKEFTRGNYADLATAHDRGEIVALGGFGLEQG